MERSQINGHDSLEFMLITEINRHKNILVLIHNIGVSAVNISVSFGLTSMLRTIDVAYHRYGVPSS